METVCVWWLRAPLQCRPRTGEGRVLWVLGLGLGAGFSTSSWNEDYDTFIFKMRIMILSASWGFCEVKWCTLLYAYLSNIFFFKRWFIHSFILRSFIPVFVWSCVSHSTHAKVGGQLSEIGSLLPPCGSWQSNSGNQAWQQASLPGEVPHQSLIMYFPPHSKCIIQSCYTWLLNDVPHAAHGPQEPDFLSHSK